MPSPAIEEIFVKNKGIADAATLREKGVSHYQIAQLLQTGTVGKLKRGLYRWNAAERHEMADIARMVPGGVFCLFSAAFFHGLSTFVPPEHHVAIPDKRKITLPPYPFIKLYYWDAVPYETGRTEITLDDGEKILVYSPEKTLCDIVKYRRQAGLDTLKEVFKNYLARPNRNIELVMQTARALNVRGIVQNYLELLL